MSNDYQNIKPINPKTAFQAHRIDGRNLNPFIGITTRITEEEAQNIAPSFLNNAIEIHCKSMLEVLDHEIIKALSLHLDRNVTAADLPIDGLTKISNHGITTLLLNDKPILSYKSSDHLKNNGKPSLDTVYEFTHYKRSRTHRP